MGNRTLKLLEQYEDNIDAMEGGEDVSVTDTPQPETPEEGEAQSLTSEGELFYIESLVDAALYSPNSEEQATLMDIQDALSSKSYVNARAEILPTVLAMFQDTREDKELSDQLQEI